MKYIVKMMLFFTVLVAPAWAANTLSMMTAETQSLEKCASWDGLTRPQKIAKDYFCWRKVGGEPYQGTVSQALARSNWPSSVQKAFTEKAEKGEGADTTVHPGHNWDWMAFGWPQNGKAKAHGNVIAAFRDGNFRNARVYAVTDGGREYRLYQVADCGNWAGKSWEVTPQKMGGLDEPLPEKDIPAALAKKPASPKSLPPPQTSPDNDGWYTVEYEVTIPGQTHIVQSGCNTCGGGYGSGVSLGIGNGGGGLVYGPNMAMFAPDVRFSPGGLSGGGGLVFPGPQQPSGTHITVPIGTHITVPQ